VADPRVLVLVLNYNAGEALDPCLRSLQTTTYEKAEIIVLDNGSSDGSLAAARRLGFEVHEFRANLGYCAAYNQAIKMYAHRADFFVLSNADLIVPPPTIDWMVRVALADERTGFVGPVQRHEDTKDIRSAGIRWRCGRLPKHATRLGAPYDALEGAFLLVRASLVTQVGGLDEHLFLNLEDVEWQFRAKAAGWRVLLVPSAEIWHRRPSPTRQVSGAYYQTRNTLYLTRRFCDPSSVYRLERRLSAEGVLGNLLGRPRGAEILRGIHDFRAGITGRRPEP
jgi:GT2 family glycosyltransferase